MHSANCKEDCKLKYASNGWLTSSDHCEWEGVECNIANEITKLKLRKKGLSHSFTLFELDRLEVLNLNVNNLSGVFTVAGENSEAEGDSFTMEALRKLAISRNELIGIEGLQLLTKLRSLQLRQNAMGEAVDFSTDDFPQSIRRLNLKSNNLTEITGLKHLENLKGLDLSDNKFSGEF